MSCFERCIVIGTGQFAFNCAKYLQEVYRLDGVYEYGSYAQSRLGILCSKQYIPYTQLFDKTECDDLMYEVVQSGKRTLIVSASNIYLFPKFITDCNEAYIINYHPALLTKHLGRNAEAWAIYEQDEATGVTWHEVTPKVDHGAVLAEKKIILDSDITAVKLMMKQYQMGFELFKGFIGLVVNNEHVVSNTVIEYGKMHYSYEKPNHGVLDLTWNGSKISAFLRSMDYGNLDVMGIPVIIEGGTYRWDGYKILNKLDVFKPDPDCRVIDKDNLYFILHNYRKVPDIKGK